ncbi:MAG: M28 family peptidase [Cyclobacteriaceae bacterium]|nr:M28 family peptidase [Cyclobacteriaceae bacterium]
MKHKTPTSSYSTVLLLVIIIFSIGCDTAKHDDSVLLSDIETHLNYLASDSLKGRSFGTEGERLAAEYIADYFESIGLSPKGTEGYFQEFSVTPSNNPHEKAKIGEKGDSSILGRNVIGYIDNNASHTVVIGAHFDHLGMGGISSLHREKEQTIHNGADDNASGTVTIMALAKIVKESSKNNNYLFIAFTGEENGLWGSNYFTKNPTIELEKVTYMLNYDMVGRLNDEKILAINGTGTTPKWEEVLDISNTDSLKLIKKSSGVGPSDHTSFYLNDIPVLHFFTGQHEDYHKPSDDVDKINWTGLLKIIRYSENLIASIDTEGKLEFTKTKDESGNTPRFKVGLGVVPDYLYDGKGMRIDGVSEDKPAQKAGLQKGDIVIHMGDSTIMDMMSYMRALSVFEKGDTTTIILKREDEELEKQIVF